MASSNNNDIQQKTTVVMVPSPMHGHLNQLLNLSRLISAYDIPVHFISTTTHSHRIKSRAHGCHTNTSANNIHFHEFPTPPFAAPPPDPNSTSKFPAHLQPLFEASIKLREPVAELLRSLASTAKRLVVIHDAMTVSVVQDLVTIPNAEAYTFQTVSAFYIFSYMWEVMGRPSQLEDDNLKDLPPMDSCFPPEFMQFIAAQCVHNFDSGTLHDVCKAMEGKYFDLLKEQGFGGNPMQWAIGPLNPVSVSDDHNKMIKMGSGMSSKCLKWLDEQAPNSVIYVSFGTTTSLPDEQIHELAIGLENSGHKFIWVLREADKGADTFGEESRRVEALPKGYEERNRKQGMILREWAPQLEILAHSSTGGFMSHCGWNSCMESITMGVPIATWPMHSDQPRNAVLITKVLRIGTIVSDWARRNELVTASTVEKAVRKLLESGEGEEMRKRAVEMSAAVRIAAAEGGVSRLELDSFVSHITRP